MSVGRLAFSVILMLAMLMAPAPVRAEQSLPAKQVIQEVTTYLEFLLRRQGVGMELVNLVHHRALKLADGEVTWQVETPVDGFVPGRQKVAVTVFVDGLTQHTLAVDVTLLQRVRVPVASRMMPRGTVIGAEDLVWREVELTRPQPDLVTDPATIVGMAPTRAIQANGLLEAGWFDAPIAVARGEKLRVLVSRGGLTIDTVAQAQAPGRVGDTIEVRNLDTQRRYQVRIIGPGVGQTLP